jgi:hypothetical protein
LQHIHPCPPCCHGCARMPLQVVCRLLMLQDCQTVKVSAAFTKAITKGERAVVQELCERHQQPCRCGSSRMACHSQLPLSYHCVAATASCCLLHMLKMCVRPQPYLNVLCCRSVVAVKWQQYGLQYRDFFSCDDNTGEPHACHLQGVGVTVCAAVLPTCPVAARLGAS